MKFEEALDIKIKIQDLVDKLELMHVKVENIVCFRSLGSKSRATARIWSLPRIWQQALKTPPHYVIEVLSEKYDKLDKTDQEKVLIHELLHVPKTFSGSLVPHKCFGKKIDRRRINQLHQEYEKLKQEEQKRKIIY